MSQPTPDALVTRDGAARMAPPPPGPALQAALATMRPVTTRRPWRAFAGLIGFAGLCFAAALLACGARPDLHELPWAWVALGALLWGCAGLATAGAALLPAHGEVLPAAGRAWRAGPIAAGLVTLFALAGGTETGARDPARFVELAVECLLFSTRFSVPFALVGGLVLWRSRPSGYWLLVGALGTSGAALAGLCLHFLCPGDDPAHLLASHAGPLWLWVGLSALWLGWRSRDR